MTRAQVVTFYSYKGGVGRTFVLANAAVVLARWGFRVLCVDFDLEAPGLRHYFDLAANHPGLVDLLLSCRTQAALDAAPFVRQVPLANLKGSLHLLAAGDDQSPEYGTKLAQLDWPALYSEHDLGRKLEALKDRWCGTASREGEYDFVFVDSRTGLTDAGGIATAQLADILVFQFAPNEQGLQGSAQAVAKARELRRSLPFERRPFLELPLPTRFDNAAVGTVRENWLRRSARELDAFYRQWRHEDVTADDLIDQLRIPYKARWSFGEPLAVLEERESDPETVTHAIATLAAFLARRLQGSDQLVRSRDEYVRDVETRNRRVLRPDAEGSFEYDVFLSYARDDAALAQDLRRELERQGRQRGFKVWLDTRDVQGGSDWLPSIARALQECRHLVVLARPTLSSWQHAEVAGFLVGQGGDTELPSHRRCIPLWHGGASPVEPLARFQGIKTSDLSLPELASRIHAALGSSTDLATVATGGAESMPDTPEQLRDDYLAYVRTAHQRLVTFFPEDSERQLDDVFVRLDVATDAVDAMAGRETEEREVDPRRIKRLREDGPSSGSATLRELVRDVEGASTDGAPPRWVLLGEPGAGKSTSARHLARELAGEGRFAIYIALARLGDSAFDPCAIAAADAIQDDGDRRVRLQRELQRLARNGEVVFLFDGLDEVEPRRIDGVAARILAIAENDYSRAPVVVLARHIAVERRDLGRRFLRGTLQPLSDTARSALLRKLLGDADAQRMEAELLSNPSLLDLCRNPLMLTLAAIVTGMRCSARSRSRRVACGCIAPRSTCCCAVATVRSRAGWRIASLRAGSCARWRSGSTSRAANRGRSRICRRTSRHCGARMSR